MKAKTNIVDIIGRYVNLQKKGREYWACCPFHHEKTPSFKVSESHQSYICFGCHKAGNVISFLMDYEKLSYREAVEFLASKAGIPIPEDMNFAAGKKKSEDIQKICAVNGDLAKYYYNTLTSPEGKVALGYLAGRGLTFDTIVKFGLGYSKNFVGAPKYLISKGYDEETLKMAGIAYVDKKGQLIDYFGGRLIVPIINERGKVIGFGGRLLENSDFAKYKNTQKTLAFDKSYTLFAINLFKKLQQEQTVDSVILVEGYMDVISLYQAGIKNVVAPMGTALTVAQCRILKRYVDKVYTCFDGDAAGQKATLRSLEMLKEAGLEVKVIYIPDDMDPDDYVKKFGKEGFARLIMDAKPLIEYRLSLIENAYGLQTLDARKKYVTECVTFLKTLDPIELDVYGKDVAAKGGVSLDTIRTAVSSSEEKKPEIVKVASNEESAPENPLTKAERFVLSCFLNGEIYSGLTMNDFEDNFFDEGFNRKLFEEIKKTVKSGKEIRAGDFFDAEDEERGAQLTTVLEAYQSVSEAKRSDFFYNCYVRLFKAHQIQYTKELIASLAKATDETEIENLKQKINSLRKSQPKR